MKVPSSAIKISQLKSAEFAIELPGTTTLLFLFTGLGESEPATRGLRFENYKWFGAGFFIGEHANENADLSGMTDMPFADKVYSKNLWKDNMTHADIEMVYEYMLKRSEKKVVAQTGGICSAPSCGVYDEFASPSRNHGGQIRCYKHW